MGNCNVLSYFLQATDVESIDTGIVGRSNLHHKENYENKCFFSKLCGHYPVSSFRKTVVFFWNTVLELPVSDCCKSPINQAPPIPCPAQFSSHGIDVCCLATRNKYHEKYHWWCRLYYQQDFFIIIIQYLTNSGHSHSIVNKPFLSFIFNDLFPLYLTIPWKIPCWKNSCKNIYFERTNAPFYGCISADISQIQFHCRGF